MQAGYWGFNGRIHGGEQSPFPSYLSLFPAAPVKVVDLHDHVVLLPREPLNSNAGVRRPGHRAQNVITGEKGNRK